VQDEQAADIVFHRRSPAKGRIRLRYRSLSRIPRLLKFNGAQYPDRYLMRTAHVSQLAGNEAHF
jgi:hypothetical protein